MNRQGETCRICGGTGKVKVRHDIGGVPGDEIQSCSTCRGLGRIGVCNMRELYKPKEGGLDETQASIHDGEKETGRVRPVERVGADDKPHAAHRVHGLEDGERRKLGGGRRDAPLP